MAGVLNEQKVKGKAEDADADDIWSIRLNFSCERLSHLFTNKKHQIKPQVTVKR